MPGSTMLISINAIYYIEISFRFKVVTFSFIYTSRLKALTLFFNKTIKTIYIYNI